MLGFDPWVRKVPWRRKWQPTPVFLPGKPHGQRSLVGYSPWGRKRIRHDLVTKQQMFVAALFTITKTWKQLKCPSTEKWIKKM